MKIYWSIQDIPELANLTPEQQKQAWRDCCKKYAFKLWQNWALLGLMAVLIAIFSARFGAVLGGAIGGGIGGGLYGVVLVNVLRPYLKTYVEQNF